MMHRQIMAILSLDSSQMLHRKLLSISSSLFGSVAITLITSSGYCQTHILYLFAYAFKIDQSLVLVLRKLFPLRVLSMAHIWISKHSKGILKTNNAPHKSKNYTFSKIYFLVRSSSIAFLTLSVFLSKVYKFER